MMRQDPTVTRRRVTPRALASGAARATLAALLLGALLGGCAGIDPFGPQPLAGAAQSAVQGRGQVSVQLAPDGIATVSGWVDERLSEQSVLRTVARYPGVTGVIDRIRVDDFYRDRRRRAGATVGITVGSP